jgi:hypothetical protein
MTHTPSKRLVEGKWLDGGAHRGDGVARSPQSSDPSQERGDRPVAAFDREHVLAEAFG